MKEEQAEHTEHTEQDEQFRTKQVEYTSSKTGNRITAIVDGKTVVSIIVGDEYCKFGTGFLFTLEDFNEFFKRLYMETHNG